MQCIADLRADAYRPLKMADGQNRAYATDNVWTPSLDSILEQRNNLFIRYNCCVSAWWGTFCLHCIKITPKYLWSQPHTPLKSEG
mmetsp:Transcript_94657/g.158928  ORF Transcript_94657/g.158928 Transcript_94657/m.158928 type:complete len:85 (-) Transcript_94657:824-1078(-)